MSEFLNYVPVEGSVGEKLLNLIFVLGCGFVVVLTLWLVIRIMKKFIDADVYTIEQQSIKAWNRRANNAES